MQYPKLLTLILFSSLALAGCEGGSDTPADSDGDGVVDSLDLFPNDATESIDTDGDGVGDNADVFPNDASETLDSDEDGVGDNADVFPNDASETLDTDEDGVGDNADAFPTDPNKTVTSCVAEGITVNLTALMTENCDNLAAFNLFKDPLNPTKDVNGTKSLKYDLSMSLFTDYATKYRFVVIPDDKIAKYTSDEAMEMPVGTVLIKTFSLPSDTSLRGFENETLIETRLLIHRDDGWVALPYRWNSEGTEATYVASGRNFDTSVTHNNELLEFKYVIPSTTDCKECHQILDQDEDGNAIAGSGRFAPIGPKARFLSYNIEYSDGEKNQLEKWQEKNMLTNLPENIADIYIVPSFNDNEVNGLADLSNNDVDKLARGYLDINCSHCHRPTGSANNYGLFLEYDRQIGIETGICKTPVAPPGDSNIEVKVNGKIVDVLPGDAENSFVYERLSTDGSLKMPKIGRSLVHSEGSELIKRWINMLDEDPFNLNCD